MYLFYDDETANSEGRICSAAAIVVRDDRTVVDHFYTLVDPECEFDDHNRWRHGIALSNVIGKPTFDEVYSRTGLADLLERCVFVAHNAKGADLYHIKKSLAAYGIDLPPVRCIDTQEMAKAVGIPEGSRSLEDICARYNIILRKHHDAYEDAKACMAIFFHMVDEFGYTPEPEEWDRSIDDSEKRSSSHKSKQSNLPECALGRVNGSRQPIEDLLEELENEGLRLHREDFAAPYKVTVSGVYEPLGDSDANKKAVGEWVAKHGGADKNVRYLAIGDNVGQRKIEDARKKRIPVLLISEFFDWAGDLDE